MAEFWKFSFPPISILKVSDSTSHTDSSTEMENVMSNIKLIGRNVGNATRKTLEATLEAHRAWVKTKSDESKASIVRDFKVGYIAGLLNVAMAESERILSNGKGADRKSTRLNSSH